MGRRPVDDQNFWAQSKSVFHPLSDAENFSDKHHISSSSITIKDTCNLEICRVPSSDRVYKNVLYGEHVVKGLGCINIGKGSDYRPSMGSDEHVVSVENGLSLGGISLTQSPSMSDVVLVGVGRDSLQLSPVSIPIISVSPEGTLAAMSRPRLIILRMGGNCGQGPLDMSIPGDSDGRCLLGDNVSEVPSMDVQSPRNSMGNDIEYLIANPEARLIPLTVSTGISPPCNIINPPHKNVTIRRGRGKQKKKSNLFLSRVSLLKTFVKSLWHRLLGGFLEHSHLLMDCLNEAGLIKH